MRVDLSFHFDVYLRESFQQGSNTWRAKRGDFNSFIAFVVSETPEIVTLGHLNSSHLKGFQAAQLRRGLSPLTINRQTSTIRMFSEWLRSRYEELRLPTLSHVADIEAPHSVPRGLLPEEIERLRNAIPNIALGNKRERIRFSFEFLLSTGMRRGELLILKANQVSGKILKNVGQKNTRLRDIVLEPPALSALERWLPIREEILKAYPAAHSETAPLVVCEPHHKRTRIGVSPETLGDGFLQLRLSANVESFSAHTLRHTRALELLDRGCDIPLIAQQLGHNDITTTQVYLRRSNEQIARLLAA